MTAASRAVSTAAYHSLSVVPLREEILSLIEAAEERGVISDDVFEYLAKFEHKNDSSVTTRYSELERLGLIYRAGDTRPGNSGRQQMVMRAAKYAATIPIVEVKSPPKSAAFKKGAAWGLRRAAKILMKNATIKGSDEFVEILREIKDIGEKS